LLLSLTVFLGSCGSDQAKRVDGESANDDGHLLTGSGGYAVRAEWERGPQLGTDNALVLQIIPRNGARMPLKNLSLTPWMTVHGHGSGSVQPVIEAIDANGGLYRVSNIFFVMAGPWDLRVVLESDASDIRSAETSLITIPVSVP
jgi:hypothetical protein